MQKLLLKIIQILIQNQNGKVILIYSKPILNGKDLKIELAVKGKEFLIARGFEKILEETLLNFSGQTFKVNYTEHINNELIKEYEENVKKTEKIAIELAEQEIMSELEEKQKDKTRKLIKQ